MVLDLFDHWKKPLGFLIKTSLYYLLVLEVFARGIAFAMRQQGYRHVTIANRTVTNAQMIIDEMGMGRAISLQQAEETLADFSVIVQMTSAGLSTGNFSMPFSLDRLMKEAIVADIVYNPLMTPFTSG